MSIQFTCAACQSQLKVADVRAGSSGKCPKCGTRITVPAAAAALPAVPADPWLTDDLSEFQTPLDEVLPPRRHRPRSTRSASREVRGYRPATVLTALTAVLIAGILILDLGFWIVAIVQFIDLQGVPADGLIDELPAVTSDLVLMGLALLYFPTYITCVVAFLMWKFRANHNAAAIAGRPLEISPGWSVGWYFVPIMNLFRPFQAMKEIYQASAPRHASTALVTAWWTLWIISNFAGQLSMRLGLRAETVGDLRAGMLMDIVIGLIDLPMCIVAILLVRRISAMQRERVEGR